MPQFESAPATYAPRVEAGERITSFLRSIYAWMAGGLAITALTATYVAASPTIVTAIAGNRLLFWAIVIAQLGIVFVLSGRVHTLASSTASMLFVAYSALTGLTLSFVLLAYTGESVATTFVVTAAMFGALAGYGTLTKKSLEGWGQFLFMGLIGVVIASIVGIFWQSSALQFVITFVRRDRLHRLDGLRCAAVEGDGAGAARRADRVLRDHGRADALPGFHQSLPDAAA